MRFTTFTFVALFLIGLNINGLDLASSTSWMIYACIALNLLVGLPHGAVDHVLSVTTLKLNIWWFYSAYVIAIVAYVILWIYLPAISFIFFLLLSAFHFGESQLSRYGRSSILHLISFLMWGLHILSSYVFYQYDVLVEHMVNFDIFQPLEPVIAFMGSSSVMMIVTGVMMAVLAYSSLRSGQVRLQSLMQEVFLLVMIHASFVAFGPIVSFTLFFVVIHSLQVLSHEWLYLKERFVLTGFAQFVVMLLPLSIISIAGLGFLYWLNLSFFDLPIVYLTIIMTAVITFPHAVVMHFFYDRSSVLT